MRCAECLLRSKYDNGVVRKLHKQFQQFQEGTTQPSKLTFISQVTGGVSGETKKVSTFNKVGSNCHENVAKLSHFISSDKSSLVPNPEIIQF